MRLFSPILAAALLAALCALLPAAGPAQTQGARFLLETAVLYASPEPGAETLGKLLIASPVVAGAARADGWRAVRLSGWTQAGAERAIYAAPGIRVLWGAVAAPGLGALGFGDSRTDPDTGQDWTRTTLAGWVPDAALADSLAPIWARAEGLFASRCTACHQRRVPARYTANQLTSFLKVMGPRAGLPKDDQFLVRAYLQALSSDSAVLAQATGEATAPDD